MPAPSGSAAVGGPTSRLRALTTEQFTEHASVADGASELFVEIFGSEAGGGLTWRLSRRHRGSRPGSGDPRSSGMRGGVSSVGPLAVEHRRVVFRVTRAGDLARGYPASRAAISTASRETSRLDSASVRCLRVRAPMVGMIVTF
jgi:hypothetical protein